MYHFAGGTMMSLLFPAPLLHIIVPTSKISGIPLQPPPLCFLLPLPPASLGTTRLLPVSHSPVRHKIPTTKRTPLPQWLPPLHRITPSGSHLPTMSKLFHKYWIYEKKYSDTQKCYTQQQRKCNPDTPIEISTPVLPQNHLRQFRYTSKRH